MPDEQQQADRTFDEPQPLAAGRDYDDALANALGAGLPRSAAAEAAAGVAALEAPPPRIYFEDMAGDVIRRFRPDAPFEAWLMLRGRVTDPRGDLIEGQQLAFAVLEFPNADVAREHTETIEHALSLLNIALARAHAARTEPIPEPATCTHRVRIERFGRRLAMQATCDRCLIVLVRDVVEWLAEHGYDHFADSGSVADGNRQTVAAIIEEAANRGR